MAEPKEKKTCFVISPIGADGTDIRKRADQVLRHVISPAVSACGFDPIRADQISEPGIITSQVIQHIVDDPLVVADLTGMNPNVFYELALRHAIRKPLVQIIEKDEKIPFDVAGMRTIQVDHRDLDSVEEGKAEIEKQVKNVVNKKPEELESPVSVSLELQALRHSDNPEERSLAEFVSAVSELRSDITSIQKRLSSPEAILPPSYLDEVLGGRRRSRETEHILYDVTHRFERMMAETEGRKTSSKEFIGEMERIRDMLTYLRHSIG